MSQDPPRMHDRRPSIDRRWALVTVALVVVLLAVLVGVYEFSGGAPSPSASSGDQSAYAKLFAQIGANGEVTKEMALEAFSLAIAPLPGVTIPAGPAPNDEERIDGTFAVDWIRPYMDQLTPDQLAVVNASLGPDSASPVFSPRPTTAGRLDAQFATFTKGDLTYYADQARQAYVGKLHRSLAVDWSVTVNATNVQVNGVDAWAYTDEAPEALGGSMCVIHVNPSLYSNPDEVLVNVVMAHEMFHCFQNDWLIKLDHANAVIPDWIIEGGANWAAEAVAGPTPYGSIGWADYLTHPEYVLWSESYNAIGFYQHMQEEGIDPFDHFDGMLTAFTSSSQSSSANPDAFKAAGAAADNFLDTWASGYFRDASEGIAWNATGPWQVTKKAEVDVLAVHPGDVKNASAQPATNAELSVASASDIIEAIGQNHVRLHIGQLPELPVDHRWICTKEGGCNCPPGLSYSGPELENADVAASGGLPGIDFGITGSLDGANVTVRGHSLDEFCKPTRTPGPTCQSNCGDSNGDPHLRTINRYRYDFQAAGEFTLLRNADSSVEIQGRQQPYHAASPGPFNAVSTNTAIAARVNSHSVGVYVTQAGLVLHVDGVQVDPTNIPDLGPGASVARTQYGLQVHFPDGTVLSALSVGSWGINAVIQPSAALAADGVGLLGPITPGGMGVPALPDGSQLPAAPDTPTRDKILYGQFAEAWSVTDSTTLFDYDPDNSTANYTDRSFPSDVDRTALELALASPDPNQQAAAQSACAAITDPELNDECTFDVFATGDDGFAQQYLLTQDLYDSGIKPPTPGPPGTPGSLPSQVPVVGAQSVAELQDLLGSAIGPDNTLYVSIDTSSGANELLAIDPTTAAIRNQIAMRVATNIYFAAGSVWAYGQAPDANGQFCAVTRYDPQTLAKQGDYPIPCTGQLTSMGDAVWFVDMSKSDPNTGAGAVLMRIDPTTNAPGASVPLPLADGCCEASQGAIFCYCGNSDQWRLTANDSAFVDIGSYDQIFPAGTGFWTEQNQSAVYVDNPSGPTVSVPMTGSQLIDNIVGGDPTGVYFQGEPPDESLSRQATDGSPLVTLAKAPTSGSDIGLTTYDYNLGGAPWFATPNGYLHLWLFKATADSPQALWLQWAPLP